MSAQSQLARAEAFRALHDSDGLFLLPNPWDVGSTRLVTGLGFQALATTSAGFALTMGRPDYGITREEKLTHIESLCAATHLPFSADLENGFGHSPETCAETITLGAKAGLVGGSIEDNSGDPDAPQYSIEAATDRIRASVEATEALPFPFTLTARAENYLTGNPDLADTIKRLQAYQEAGASVLYAPGLPTLDAIKSVLANIDRPLNVLFGPFEGFVPISELASLGVRRVSIGSGFANAAYGEMVRAAKELLGPGTFGFMKSAPSGDDLVEIINSAK